MFDFVFKVGIVLNIVEVEEVVDIIVVLLLLLEVFRVLVFCRVVIELVIISVILF